MGWGGVGGVGGGGGGRGDCLRNRATRSASSRQAPCVCPYQSLLSVQRIYFRKDLTISIRTSTVTVRQMRLVWPSVLEDCMLRDDCWEFQGERGAFYSSTASWLSCDGRATMRHGFSTHDGFFLFQCLVLS